jgi:CHAT domain-containing protein
MLAAGTEPQATQTGTQASRIFPPEDDRNGQIRLLLVSARPADLNGIDLTGEMDGIIEAIELSDNGRMFPIRNLEHCQKHHLINALNRWDPDIVHFAGHGAPDPLSFLDEIGHRADMTKTDFQNLIGAARRRSLRGLVLNACFSAHDAQRFAEHGINVIGMQRPVRDDAAKLFSALFYDKLGDGKTFKQAFDAASRLVKRQHTEAFHPEYCGSHQNRPVRML